MENIDKTTTGFEADIKKMELEITKKTREMELKKLYLAIMRKIKTLDEEYEQGRKQRLQVFEQKGEDLRAS